MKIGVIADTHLNRPSPFLEKVVQEYFGDVDLILHAGDIKTPEVLSVFKEQPFYAVSGNWDDSRVKREHPEKLVFEAGGFKIGLIHGWGSPFRIGRRLISCFDNIDSNPHVNSFVDIFFKYELI